MLDRQTKKEFCYIRDVLGLKPYQRMTDTAEYKLIKYAMEDNMASAGRRAKEIQLFLELLFLEK